MNIMFQLCESLKFARAGRKSDVQRVLADVDQSTRYRVLSREVNARGKWSNGATSKA